MSPLTPRPEYCTETQGFPCTMPYCTYHGKAVQAELETEASDKSPIIGSTDEELAKIVALGWEFYGSERLERRHAEDGYTVRIVRYRKATRCQHCNSVTEPGRDFGYGEGDTLAEAMAGARKQAEQVNARP